MDSIQIDGLSFALVLLSVINLALLYVVLRQSKGLEVSFPPAALGMFEAALSYAKTQAGKTPTQLDDKALEVIGQVVPMFTKSDPDELQAAG